MERTPRTRRGNGAEDCTAEESGESGVEESRAACDGACGDKPQRHRDEAEGEPRAAADGKSVEPQREQTAHRDSVDMGEGVRRRDPPEMTHPKQRRSDEKAEQNTGQNRRAAENANNGSPEEVVLLLDGERPCGADRRGQGEMKEVLQEEKISPPWSGAEGFEDRLAYEPGGSEITDDENEDIDRPDAESATSIEVAEVARLRSGFEQDRSDQKT